MALTAIYFYWERNMVGQWNPRCSHGDEPTPIKVSKDDVDPRSPVYPVPADCIDLDGSPNFGKLMKRFPLRGRT